ncbi:hypothetical protein HO133_002283 [Letharia lupina]|uniref:Glycosyltransferase family 25 protein n=1 Tax=Letharia lupina TaxID=560253 RepID=A0A8H6CDE6_9LECA|nr:uncharacterized protein HO133_002283 [Letharia lupina]KAF6221427.1 hypothetical protein HO133_002283 [Letharia lupina]
MYPRTIGMYTGFDRMNTVFMTKAQRHKKMIKPLLIVALCAILALFLGLQRDRLFPSSSLQSSSSNSSPSTSSKLAHVLSQNSIQAIHNNTLGFGDVYFIHMPGRTDKLDSLRLLTSITNISYTIIPGVDGKGIPHVAWPGFYKEGERATSITGCWRAHINAAASILDNNLSSALILEDDADWDVSLKNQLTQFALGTRHILDAPTSSEPLSPYGDGWDMLWLGHCAQNKPTKPFSRFIIANDTTVRPAGHRWHLWNPEPTLTYDLPHNRTTRVVYRSAGGMCSYAYALSYTGAQKLLYYLSYSHFNDPVDVGHSRLCKRGSKGEIDFSCVVPYPGLVYTASVQNDIEYHPDKPRKDRDKKKGAPGARNLVFGVRANMKNIIEGKEAEGRGGEEEKIREEMGEMGMWFDEGKTEL